MDGRSSLRAQARRLPCGSGPGRLLAVTMALAGALTVVSGPAVVAAPAAPVAWQDVVVTGPGDTAAAQGVVDAAGGRLGTALPIISGVVARLPVGTQLPAGWSASPQRSLTTASTSDAASSDTANLPASTVRSTLGLAPDGREGAGVTVAVMDTGVADVPDLAGRVSARVDITGTGTGTGTGASDGHGHGTFMAGLIAGSGAGSGGAYQGVAPAADLVDVKVADEHGGTDLITVLRGLQWVDDHRRDIQVLNLSLSSGSTLPYQVDPLTQALDALWRKGVVVVVPSGNTGPGEGTVTSPGLDPTLLTVGGLDEGGTAGRADDTVAAWSGRGGGGQRAAKPDLVAPGAHPVGLLAPGSDVDVSYPGAHVGSQYVRGSGTSMSTAVTSGVVADLLARRPGLRPDAVKGLLTSTAYAGDGLASPTAAGAGGVDAARALATVKGYRPAAAQPDRDAAALAADAQWWRALDEAIRKGDGSAASQAWSRLSPESRAWAGSTWSDLDASSRAWASRAWAGEDWASRAWASRAWASRAWAGEDWASRAWAGDDWASRAWAGHRWSSRAWAWLPTSP